MMEKPATIALNHLLLEQDWARASLRPFATKCVVLRLMPLPDLRLVILDSGVVAEAPSEAVADLTATIPLASLPRLLVRDEAAMAQVEMVGPADLASTVQILFQELTWDAEQDLSKLFGDVLAHRIAGAARDALAWQKDAATRLAQNLSEFLAYEQPLLAQRGEADSLRHSLESLVEDCARVQDRLDQLETGTKT
ncbi:MAG: hypothetical protein A3G25_15740 [Betaproteobacteria bacterium RIFCSPLOWO2_12_FULL_63_13]|nr:MAG: hypothetical protein A3G25_15740 [Betaproteobacteria bacterium RIFCSPLOWO2_12_FULL_63_13]